MILIDVKTLKTIIDTQEEPYRIIYIKNDPDVIKYTLEFYENDFKKREKTRNSKSL